MEFDPAKLARLQASAAANRVGGKGTPRRKVVAKPRPGSQVDDKKLQGALKKLNTQPIQGVEEVNMFKEDGNVIHFTAPKVHASMPSNTYAIYGQGVDKELTELVPGILNQLGPDHMANLRRIAESYQAQQQGPGANLGGEREADDDDDDDDEPPELVPAEAVGATEGGSLEDIN